MTIDYQRGADLDYVVTYGVFVWDSSNVYRRENAIREFKRESSATRFADAHPDRNYVVRRIYTNRDKATRRG